MRWVDAVWLAVQREAAAGGGAFTRHGLLVHQLAAMRADTATAGATPSQTISRVLQELRDSGAIIFLGGGRYQLSALTADAATTEAALATQRAAAVMARLGQGRFRTALLRRFGGACPMTGIAEAGLLRASHIIPWARCWPERERLNPDNGLLLSPLWDAAFDRGLVSFADDGRALAAADVGAALGAQLRAATRLALPQDVMSAAVCARLAQHRALYAAKNHRPI